MPTQWKVETRTSVGVDHPIKYKIAADHHLRDLAEGLADTYIETIISSIVNQPRSQQKRIGPSEMGVECKRAILHKINGDTEPPRLDIPWKPTIGTAVHTYLDEAFTNASLPGEVQAGRWLTEERVTVGKIGPTEITGSTDLFCQWTNSVMDHKVVGDYTLKNSRANGPSPQYRGQAHTYGKGWVARGYDVKLVAICFLPRQGELTDTFIWTEPYDERIADAIINKCESLYQLNQAVGIEKAIEMFPPCEERYCKWCGTGSTFARRAPSTSTAALFNIK